MYIDARIHSWLASAKRYVRLQILQQTHPSDPHAKPLSVTRCLVDMYRSGGVRHREPYFIDGQENKILLLRLYVHYVVMHFQVVSI